MDLLGFSNSSANFAARNLKLSQSIIQRSLERISSGMRINRASDDPAGLALSEKLRSQVRGLNREAMNAMDRVGMLQVADSGLGEISAALQEIRELSVQAANSVYTDSDRAVIQQQIDQQVEHINYVAGNTQFNSKTLLAGELGSDARAPALGLEGINVTSVDAASTAISTVDASLTQVSEFRSNLGSEQNRLISRTRSLEVAAENTLAAESRIRDTDYAAEILNLTRAKILQRASMTAFAQANQNSISVMQLLLVEKATRGVG